MSRQLNRLHPKRELTELELVGLAALEARAREHGLRRGLELAGATDEAIERLVAEQRSWISSGECQ